MPDACPISGLSLSFVSPSDNIGVGWCVGRCVEANFVEEVALTRPQARLPAERTKPGQPFS